MNRTLALRLGFGFFTLYLVVMVAALLSPAVFNLVMGNVGLSWPETPSREFYLMINMNLCGAIPTAYMAGRTALRGEWTRINRGFFLCMLIGNLLANGWSIMTDPAFASILAGDSMIVTGLLCLAVLVRPR